MTLSFDVVPSEHPTMSKLPVTGRGHAALEEELRHRTRVERMRVIERIQDAIADEPDIAESSEYQTAKAEQEMNEARISELEDKLARAEVIDVSKLSGETIKFGATVTLIDEDTGKKKRWQIVGEPEADASKGGISVTSPLARALIGKRKGAKVEVQAPGGAKSNKVLKIEWIEHHSKKG
jgi:transcription elongation factor GreA